VGGWRYEVGLLSFDKNMGVLALLFLYDNGSADVVVALLRRKIMWVFYGPLDLFNDPWE